MRTLYKFLSVAAVAVLMAACNKLLPPLPPDDQVLDGPLEGLSGEENAAFLRGDIAFNNEVFTAATGLGPLFVATSCGSCHAGDGKGHPFTTLTRFGQSDTVAGNTFLKMGGPQLQDHAIPGYKHETIPAGAAFTRLLPPANTGLGFVDAVTDADLLLQADPDDLDGDGISGRPNWIHIPGYVHPRTGSVVSNGRYIGRFGKKASTYDLLMQTANAYNQDMGITSSFEFMDTYTGLPADPEVSNATVNDVVMYLKFLKAPIQRNASAPDVMAGRQIFLNIGCGKCHTPMMKTGFSPVDALSFKTFFPYSDFLLHDMGNGLNDGYTEGTALPSEWRTPALWGLGLSPNAQGGVYYLMHDGRARSIEEAITLHGGEGAQSNSKYTALTTEEKKQVLRFLESL